MPKNTRQMANKKYSYQDDWDAIYSSTDKFKPWIGAEVAMYLKEVFDCEGFIESHKGDSILDVGCGDGSFCQYLASKGYKHVKGIDTSSIIIGKCNGKSRGENDTVSFERKDIIVDDFTNETYDTVVCWLVLHHIRRQDLGAFIHNLSLLCKRNANVFISFLTTEQEGLNERNSLFSEDHNVIYYDLNDIVSRFSPFFDVTDVGQGVLAREETETVFPYHILKMRKRRISRDDWVSDLREFKERMARPVDYTELYSTLMELLRDFAFYSNANQVLDSGLFDELFQKLFRNVSRYICKRLLQDVSDEEKTKYVIILKLNDHSSGVVFSATQYAWDQDGFRPHCRYMDNESKHVSSRAYDLFLAYDQFLRADSKRKHRPERFTLQDHFIQDPQLGSFSFSWNERNKGIVVSPVKEQKYIDQKKDYSAFLESMFRKPTGKNEYERFLSENYHGLFIQERVFTQQFFCFNLGVPGYESWGTIMIDAYDSEHIIEEKFLLPNNRNGRELESELFHEIKNLIFILKKLEYDYYDKYNTNEITTQAVKAAIAKAMARNMSHNIGSHVLSNLVEENIYDELSDTKVKDLKSYDSNREDLFVPQKDRQLAYFMRYLKSRMDYMSEITFGSPSLLANRRIFGDVMKEFDGNRILLNHISGIPGFRYGFNLLYGEEEGERPLEKEDISAAFPGDVIGCQAFYNIIENVIRNTAKHTRRQNGGEPAVFTIRFKEPEGCEGVEGADEMYCVEIGSNVMEPKIDEIVTAQNVERLNRSVLDESHNLRSHSLGLLEMEASAAFLRQLDLHEIESDDYSVDDNDLLYHENNGRKRLNIIKAFPVHNGKKDEEGKSMGSLAYRFFIQKPKEFLFVGNWDAVDEISKNTLRSKGVEFRSFVEFKELMEKGKAFAHTYLLYDSSAVMDFGEYDTLLPLRRISVDDVDKREIVSFLKGDNVFADLRDYVWSKLNKGKYHIRAVIPLEETIKSAISEGFSYVVPLHHPETAIFEKGYKLRETIACAETRLFVERLSSRTLERMPCYYDLSGTGDSTKPEDNYFDHFIERKWKEEDRRAYSWIVKEIADAYGAKVITIDERIQKYAEENTEDGFPCWALFEMTNVFLPRGPRRDVDGSECMPLDITGNPISAETDSFIPLAPEDFGTYREKLEEYLEKHLDDSFLLIHYGVLERMYGGGFDKGSNRIYEMLTSWSTGKYPEWAGDKKAKARRVIVTSGRGSHSLRLPPTVCFVNLSSVLYAFCESRNKYLISVLLNQSRRKSDD